MLRTLPLFVCLALSLPDLALAQDASTHGGHGAMSGDLGEDWAAINARMHEGMSFTPSGDVDRDFLTGMIAHHKGAIEMAELVLAHGTDPRVRALAEAIIAAQAVEIEEMEAMLAD